jgi:hypothetical protein
MAGRSNLEKLSVAELHAEIKRRQRQGGKLEKKREALLKQVAEIDALLNDVGAEGGRGGKSAAAVTRARNSLSLLDALRQSLKGKTMGVADAMAAVRKNGYISNSPSFRVMVNQQLLKTEFFKRVGRGQYQGIA